jgi:cellulose synthase (UDP-forming)
MGEKPVGARQQCLSRRALERAMTPSAIWQGIGAGENALTKFVRLIFLLAAAAAFCFLAVLPLSWPQQVVLGFFTLAIAILFSRGSDSYLVTLTLMMISMFSTLRYGYWRVQQVVRYVQDPASHWGALDIFFILCLLFAEAYAFLILFLGYFQTIWPLRRAPVSLPEHTDEWPHIDVLIPTLNEPLDVVRFTALSALNMDWPPDKLHIYILDDGRRKEFEKFSFDAGIGYKTRDNNVHAKAGNINNALKTINSPFLAIFDCDHVPTRSFLQITVGWFLRDRKLAMLQTPHHFYSPDPIERNLKQFRIIPNEGEFFYSVVQDGNDFWNASFFCGSCAVLRRSALDDVGGIAHETVTEDAHTSLRMQMKGWSTAYINIPQAAGLATERLSAHVRQRIRWARGMVQILRTDNPLFTRGLTFAQRLCYFNAMCHFLYALPRLIFLTAPLVFLLLDHTSIPGYWAAIVAYALPHLALSVMTSSRIQGEHRYSFWNEIYETMLAPYILLPTLLAFVSPSLGKFNVTAKGGVVKRTFFDSKIALPFLMMFLFNIAGVIMAIPRFLIWNRDRPGTVMMNLIWCLFNLIILGVCAAVARELKQLRTSVRVNVATRVRVELPDGRSLHGETLDMSSGGTSIRLSEAIQLKPETKLRLRFSVPAAGCEVPATVVSSEGLVQRVSFEKLSIAEEEVLATALFSRADSWLGWGQSRESDNALRSLGKVFLISMRGLIATIRSLFIKENSLSIARTSILIALAAMSIAPLHGQPASPAKTPTAAAAPHAAANTIAAADNNAVAAPGHYEDMFTLNDTGSPLIELRGIDSKRNIYFTLPETRSIHSARIHIYYAFSPGLLPQFSHIKLLLNGALVGTIQPTPGQSGGSDGRDTEADLTIPQDLLAHNNTLTFEFIGHYTAMCEDPANTTLWARVHRNTYLIIGGDRLQLSDDLKHLPIPFIDQAVTHLPSIPIVFASEPSLKAIQAAGVISSYFGMVSESRAVRFPVQFGAIPQGNAILIAENAVSLPVGLALPPISAPTVAIRTNPNDPFGKVLIIAGADADQTVIAAQTVALHSAMLAGGQSTVKELQLPARSQPDDAPRWARIDQTIPLWDYSAAEQLQSDGTSPLTVNFRVPPDMFYVDRPNALLKLNYRYNSIPIGPISSMQVRINDVFIDSVPLVPGQEVSRATQQYLAVPVANLRPFSNSLSFDFTFQLLKGPDCNNTTPTSMQGSILDDSYLDLRGFSHYAPLPNLQTFANAGFPFTRIADLGETTVVLPPKPTEQEVEAFLTLLGHFGRQTGYPALRVTVAGPAAIRAGVMSDFLILGTDDDQSAFRQLAESLPVSMRNGQVRVRDTRGFLANILHHAWWKLKTDEHTDSGQLIASGTPDALIQGIESPFAPGANRSIVAIQLGNAATVDPFLDTFLKVQQAGTISGSVSVLHGAQFQSFRIGSHVYHVGTLPWWVRLQLWFRLAPWLAAVIVVILAFLLAIWTRQWLRIRARARLKMVED